MSGFFILLFLAACVGVIKPYVKGMRRWHFALIAVVCLILIGQSVERAAPPAGAPSPTASASSAQPASTSSATATPGTAATPTSKWQYSEDRDEMRGTTTQYARLDSENEIDLGFPYGRVRGQLWVRRRPEDGLNVMFSVDEGQILCHSFQGDHVSAKFDDGAVQRIRCNSTSDGSSDMVFLQPAAAVLRSLKSANRTIIEAEFYDNGRQQFTFDTSGLRWE